MPSPDPAPPPATGAVPFWPFDPTLMKTLFQGPVHSYFQMTLDSQRILAEATMKEMETLEAARHRLSLGYEQLMSCQKVSDLPAAYATIATVFSSVATAQTRLAAEFADRMGSCCAQLAGPQRDRKGH